MDALLDWIEAAQPVAELCELALATRREPEPEPGGEAAPALDQRGATGKALVAQVVRPSQLTYGELPLRQLKTALEKVREHGGLQDVRAAAQFVDLGCGGGKLVLAAAVLLQPLAGEVLAAGIELMGPMVAEAEVLRGLLVAKLTADGTEIGAAAVAAVSATKFLCGDVLDDAGNAAAGVGWGLAAHSSVGTSIVLVNGLCFPAKVKAAVCQRLCGDGSSDLASRFVLSTTPLPWPSASSGAATCPEYKLVYSNEEVRFSIDFLLIFSTSFY